MPLPLIKRFSFPVATRKVVLLPDSVFFSRTVPIAEGATAADVATQVQLALEAMAPFPVAQLYHGHFWRPGAKHACAYAAYRKRFPAEEIASWTDSEAVMPTFAALLGAQVDHATTILLKSDTGLTAVSWEDPHDAPVSVVMRALPPEPTEADRAAVREDVLRQAGGAGAVVELDAPPVLDQSDGGSDEFIFRADQITTVFTREQLDEVDVRDKDELAARRRARARDLVFWRTFVGCAAALFFASVFELVLIGGQIWRTRREQTVERQMPLVDKIKTEQNLVTRIDELSTKRMRPFEMISAVSQRKPPSVVFLSTTVTGLYTLDVEAQTGMPTDVDAFRSALLSAGNYERVDIQDLRSRDGTSTFRLVVTFKPTALSPGASS